MKKYFKEYKTTIQGVLGFAAVGFYWCNMISTEQVVTALGVCTSLGLIGSKDVV